MEGHSSRCHVKLINFPVYKDIDGFRILRGCATDLIMESLWSVKADSIFSSVTGLIKKKHKCSACSNVLKINPQMNKITAKVCLKNEVSFYLEISMPMVICGYCHKKVIIRKRKFTDQMDLALGDAIKAFRI